MKWTLLIVLLTASICSADFQVLDGTYSGITSFYTDITAECGSATLVNAFMQCSFHTDYSYACNISGTSLSNSSYFAGSYFITDDRLSLGFGKNQSMCMLIDKTFNELQGTWSLDNVAVCPPDTASQCPQNNQKANIQTFDLFGPGLSSFELFGILVAASAVIVIIAVVAEACRSKMAALDDNETVPLVNAAPAANSNYSPLKFFVLAMGMTISGTINTISTKFADISYSEGSDGEIKQFSHPFFQASIMFLGEMLCGVVAIIIILYNRCCSTPPERQPKRNESISSSATVVEEQPSYNPLIFILPACCDMVGTSMFYMGLLWTYASVYQMLRGSVVIWTGVFSMIFLRRRLLLFHWTGMLLVLSGLALVGVASFMLGSGSDAPNPILGDVFVLAGCVVTASQMVIEEKFISKYKVPPLQVVGWEGFWGFIILSCLLVGMYFIPGSSAGNHFENSIDAFVQISNSNITLLALIGNLFSIALFNFFGISMTVYSSATTRTIIDTIRTIVIWSWGLLVGWQKFAPLQIGGFVLLLLGTMIYNRVITIPISICKPQEQKNLSINDEKQSLVKKSDQE